MFVEVGQSGLSHLRHLAVTAMVGTLVSRLGSGKVIALCEELAEVQRAGGVAPFVGAAVRGLRTDQVAALFQKHA